MVFDSVMARIGRRDSYGDHLAPGSAERAGAVHQFEIQVIVHFHNATMDAVHPEYVIGVRNAITRWNLRLFQVGDKRHCLIVSGSLLDFW